MKSILFLKSSLALVSFFGGQIISQAASETILKPDIQFETNSSRILSTIQENISKGRWTLKCEAQLFGAMPQSTAVNLTFDQIQKKLSLGNFTVNDTISLSLNSTDKNNQMATLPASQSGFVAQNSSCESKSKLRVDFTYIEKKGSGILGTDSPLGTIRVEKSKRDLSLSSACSSQDISDCSCTDSEYLLRDIVRLECGIYNNPYSEVKGAFTSPTLEQIYNTLSTVSLAERASVNSGPDDFAKLQDGALLKFHIINAIGKGLSPSILWNSIPYFTQQSTLNSVSTQLFSEENPTEAMIYAGLLFNDSFDSQAVKSMILLLKKNDNLKFYHFMASSSVAEHSVQGWLVVDTTTGELFVARHIKSYLLERELIFKKTKSVPLSGLMPGINKSDRESLVPSKNGACIGTEVFSSNTTLQAKGDLSKCFLKNNPRAHSLNGSDSIEWDDVLKAFVKGSELSIDSSFESPGVCYDLDGIPHNIRVGELGETKRAPNYIVKVGSKVALYSHQVLERIGHGIWPIGEAACNEKEMIYEKGAKATFSWAKADDFKTEAVNIKAYPNQCFTYYQGALNYSTQGVTHFFLRKTNMGIVMLWPRPSLAIDRLDDLSLMCIFPSQAIKSASLSVKK